MFSRHKLRSAALLCTPVVRGAPAYVIAVLLLCLPALWNGFPLMFDDVGGYLERWPAGSLALGRSTVYGLMLWFARPALFAPAIVLQALATTFVIDRAIRAFAPEARSPWLLVAAVAGLSAVSGMALYVSKAMPDAWAAPAVLALHLLAWHPLRPWERAVMAAIVAFAGASHMATFAVLAGMSLVHAAAWLMRNRLRVAPHAVALAAAAVWSGLVLQAAGNFAVTGRVALQADGQFFLFARMIEDGMAADVLAEECPGAGWKMCRYRGALPPYAEAFLFFPDGPLQTIGGAFDPGVRREIAAIVSHMLVRNPLAHAQRALALTAEQFMSLGISDEMERLWSDHTRTMFVRHAPAFVPWFDAARQQRDEIDLGSWSDWAVVPVSLAASFALPLVAVLLWRRGRRRDAMLPGLLFVALVGNAAACGAVAGPNDRYQARLAWLAPLALGLTGRSGRRCGTEPSPLVMLRHQVVEQAHAPA
jgi:hypothetical protein